jgi:hypothetical protein
MDFRQSTFEEIIESEHDMLLKAEENYGEYFTHASEFNAFLCNFIKSIDDPTKFFFIMFLSQIKKHHTLALFSAVRRHHIQTGMDMRQVYEAGAWGAYAMAFSEKDKFYSEDGKGILWVTTGLEKRKNKWLNENFKEKSDWIKNMKKLLGSSVAHANVIYAIQNFSLRPENEPGFNTPFFDFEDDLKVKSNLWTLGNIALGLIDLLYGVNLQYKVFQVHDDFGQRYKRLVDQNNKLKEEIVKNPRFSKTR